MDKKEIQTILQNHLADIHNELSILFRGIEKSLNAHLVKTEAAIADIMEREHHETSKRFDTIEKRLRLLEERS